MYPKYVVQNSLTKEAGQYLELTAGESLSVALFLFSELGTPEFFTPSPTQVVATIYTGVGNPPILKELSLSTLALITETNLGPFGFTFKLLAADTATMVVNNAGLAAKIVVTYSNGDILEYDFARLFNPLIPAVAT